MKKKYLTLKVFFVHLLIQMRLLPNVWYQCELDLSKIWADEVYEILKIGE